MYLLLSFIQIGFWLLGGLLVVMVSYLLFLSVAAWLSPTQTAIPTGPAIHHFFVLIPAHNEEKLLPKLLDNLSKLDYPKTHYTVHVVADNCTDQTATVARKMGAVVHERHNLIQVGKGYALQWLLSQIWEAGKPFDAAVIIDADSVVSTNFLQVMDARLQQGARVVQACDAVLDPGRSWAISLRAAAMAMVNYVRPQGRTFLGSSVGLKGNGMVFHQEVLKRYAWSAAVTEDLEYHMALILQGVRVVFAPDAVVWAEMPETLAGSHTQNVRWEQGRLEMAKHYIPRLWAAAWAPRHNSQQLSPFVYIDALMEHLIPPFAVLTSLSLVYLAGAIWLGSNAGLWVGMYLFGGQFLYLIIGMILAKFPRAVYLALLYTPIFIAWKIWLYLLVFFKFEQQGWVRTARDNS